MVFFAAFVLYAFFRFEIFCVFFFLFTDKWEDRLPKCARSLISRFTGTALTDDETQVRLHHIVSSPDFPGEIEWFLMTDLEIFKVSGFRHPEQIIKRAVPNTLSFQGDWNRSKKEKSGWNDATLIVRMMDVYPINGHIGSGSFSFVSMAYLWPQYVAELSAKILQDFYISVEGNLRINAVKSNSLVAFSGIPQPSASGFFTNGRYIQPGMLVSFHNEFSGEGKVAALGNLYGFVLGEHPYKQQVRRALDIMKYVNIDDEIMGRKNKELQVLAHQVHLEVALCFSYIKHGKLFAERLADGCWQEARKALELLYQKVSKPQADMVPVRFLLGNEHLPTGWKSDKMRPDQLFQLDLFEFVKPDAINQAMRLNPFALHPHGNAPTGGVDFPKMPFDRFIIAHMAFRLLSRINCTGRDLLAAGRRTESFSMAMLQGLHGDDGGLPVYGIIERVCPFPENLALAAIASSLQLFGYFCPDHSAYQRFISEQVVAFAKGKTRLSMHARADNSVPLNVPGPIAMALLHKTVPWRNQGSDPLNPKNAVTLNQGLLKVMLPDFPSAKGFLGFDNGLFDFNAYGLGFVELYAPIVVKWEIYDTTRSLADRRSVDGSVAITFAYYEARGRMNDNVIRSTQKHKKSRRQLEQPPSKCDGWMTL